MMASNESLLLLSNISFSWITCLFILINFFNQIYLNSTQQNSCENDEFQCKNGSCIPDVQVCNGWINCNDSSDETYELCWNKTCDQSRPFQCSYGGCLPFWNVCNSKRDCADGSDEAHCPLMNTSYRCNKERIGDIACASGNQCIRPDQKCDGRMDCKDGSDESYKVCKFYRVCSDKMFKCDYGGCVPKSAMCNGQIDCIDGSDETQMECNKSSSALTLRKDLCGPNQFQCGNENNFYQCIDKSQACDGIRHCPDGSDETYKTCSNRPCDLYKNYRCFYGGCYLKEESSRYHCVNKYPDSRFFYTWKKETLDALANNNEQIQFPEPDTFFFQPEESDLGCWYPSQPLNGYYNVTNPPKITSKTVAPKWTIIMYTCYDGFQLQGEVFITCMGNKWGTKTLPQCVPKIKTMSVQNKTELCPPIFSFKHSLSCEDKKRNLTKEGWVRLTCGEPMSSGSHATIACSRLYEPEHFIQEPYNGLRCANGKWPYKLYRCKPLCGITKGNKVALDYSDDSEDPSEDNILPPTYKAERSEFPWHVGVYKKDSTDYEQICCGTIISELVVLTAAHCFWNYDTKRPVADGHNYLLGAGKFYRKFIVDDWKEKVSAQFRNPAEIIIHPQYRALESSFTNDIAIIILNVSLRVTDTLMPACVDWNLDFHKEFLQQGQLGNTVGWGLAVELSEQSENLQAANIPYVSNETCWSETTAALRPSITYDKFCTSLQNGTNICTGDSGSGIVFQKGVRSYLQGILSVGRAKGNTCDVQKYVTYTDISQHIQWIRSVAAKYF